MKKYDNYRYFLKDSIRKEIDFRKSDQSLGHPAPPSQERVDPDALVIPLPAIDTQEVTLKNHHIAEAIGRRESRRRFTDAHLTLEELSFLLWSTQAKRDPAGAPHLRTVPSAGARHSFETYLFINRVETLSAGLYRYLPLSHKLVLLYEAPGDITRKISQAVFGQKFVALSSVVFVWATVPYRMEWRYLEAAHRVILLDAGHVCQNLYLACEALELGTCAIAAYDQEAMDSLLRLDGDEQFTVYLAPVGRY